MNTVDYKIINFENGILTIQFDDQITSLPLFIVDGKYPEGSELQQLILDKINEVQTNRLIQTPNASNISSIQALVTKSASIIDIDNLKQHVRRTRAQLLEATDWTQIPDSPLDSITKSQWANYRLALRDITKQTSFPTIVNWPISPTIVCDAYGIELTDVDGKPKTLF